MSESTVRFSRKAWVIVAAVSRRAPGVVASQRSPAAVRPSAASRSPSAIRRASRACPASRINSTRSTWPSRPTRRCSCGRSSTSKLAGAAGPSGTCGISPATGNERSLSFTIRFNESVPGRFSAASAGLAHTCGPSRNKDQKSTSTGAVGPDLGSGLDRPKNDWAAACCAARLDTPMRSTPSSV